MQAESDENVNFMTMIMDLSDKQINKISEDNNIFENFKKENNNNNNNNNKNNNNVNIIDMLDSEYLEALESTENLNKLITSALDMLEEDLSEKSIELREG
jgi:hypothetical protein